MPDAPEIMILELGVLYSLEIFSFFRFLSSKVIILEDINMGPKRPDICKYCWVRQRWALFMVET